MAGIGNQINHLREGVRAALLGDIYQLVSPHLSEEKKNEFDVFYQEMVVGMDAVARERGVQPKTVGDLCNYLYRAELPETVLSICDSLLRLMEPPEPLDL